MTNVAKLEQPQKPEAETKKPEAPKRSILLAMSERYGMEPEPFEATVRATCFPATPPATREEFAAGMQIAHRLELNPLTKEVHFARAKGGGIQALIGIDGWFVMANRHPQYDGCEFDKTYSTDDKGVKTLTAMTCRIFRKDRQRPTEIEELMEECKRPNSEAWKLTPSRMLRHRAFGQCARIAFSFVGVMDTDEFQRWQEMKDVTPKQVLDVPDAIDEEEAEATGETSVSEAESSQDAPFPDPAKYLSHLSEELAAASDKAIFDEIWEAHVDGSDGRLSQAHQDEAKALYEKHGARFEAKPAAKKKPKGDKDEGGALL